MLDSLLVDTVNVVCTQIDSIGVISDSIVNNSVSDTSCKMSENWGIAIFTVLASALISALVFFIGQFQNKRNTKRLKRQEIEMLRTTILGWVDLSKKSITDLSTYLNVFSEEIKSSKSPVPKSLMTIPVLATKIDSISLEKMVDVFIINSTSPKDNKNNENMYNIIYNFHLIVEIEKDIFMKYQSYNDYFMGLCKEWNDYDDRYNDWHLRFNNWISELVKEPSNQGNPHIKFIKDYNAICDEYKLGEQENMKFIYKKLTKPILDLIDRSEADGNFIIELITIQNKKKLIYDTWAKYNSCYNELFDNYSKKIKNANESLIACKKYFDNNTKVKSIWEINSK